MLGPYEEDTPIILFHIHPQSGMSEKKQRRSAQKKNEKIYSFLAMDEIRMSTKYITIIINIEA